ncbi:hypothetical protein F4808DRAFT_474373 [Astrocystis sublimbata]|nr:hypothetical protein F4808DRAFT_474373 [Astrocystis sublimbata]
MVDTNTPTSIYDLSVDLLYMIFDVLEGDSCTLGRMGLVCRPWRTLSLPFMLKHVSLGCNGPDRGWFYEPGRVYERANPMLQLQPPSGLDLTIKEDQWDARSVLWRQRAFIRLMTHRPDLARNVKTLAWTLIWTADKDGGQIDIDQHTWDCFRQLKNVTRLDLGSQSFFDSKSFDNNDPTSLFPAVIYVRLTGFMKVGMKDIMIRSRDRRRVASIDIHGLGWDPLTRMDFRSTVYKDKSGRCVIIHMNGVLVAKSYLSQRDGPTEYFYE